MSSHQVRLEVRLPEGHWSGDVTRANPSAILRIEKHMPLSRGRGTARISSSEDISKSIGQHPGIEDFNIIQNNNYDVTIVAGGGGFLKPLIDVGIIPHTPFEVRDGWVDWTIECSQNDIKELINSFKQQSIPHRLVSTRSVTTRLLTPRQRQVFDIAIREGFYDIPRRISLTELANLLGVAKSTLSVQLQRVESTIVHTFSEDIRRRSP
ncbi:MAG: helix-turn-helix domain-containing protein [Candidatus Poseidoniaceae archaeon]|nr:helix-turn-helix domain-containing protein [Candidatus Poseidoniaceae archaeon]